MPKVLYTVTHQLPTKTSTINILSRTRNTQLPWLDVSQISKSLYVRITWYLVLPYSLRMGGCETGARLLVFTLRGVAAGSF